MAQLALRLHRCYTACLVDMKAADETQSVLAFAGECTDGGTTRRGARSSFRTIRSGGGTRGRRVRRGRGTALPAYARRGGQGARAAAPIEGMRAHRADRHSPPAPQGALAERGTVKASAGRCDVAVTTAFRWHLRRRWRPLRTSSCVEADEIWPAGERKLETRRRGGKRSLSRERSRSLPTTAGRPPARSRRRLTPAL